MGKHEKLMIKILSGRQDANILFSEAVTLMKSLGFTLRIKGSHHIFSKKGVDEIINIQPDGSKAKVYQIRQIRNLIIDYQLEEENE